MPDPFNKFRGTGVAIITPFTKSGTIDFPAYGRIIDFVIAGGVEYIVALGTTGETPTLSGQEKKALIEYSIGKIRKRIPLVIGTGGNNTSEVVSAVKALSPEGIDAILSVSPYYNKPTQEGIYRHFKAVAEASVIPLILYNVPGRTGINLAATTTVRLAKEFSTIIGIKEASGNLDQIYQIVKNRPPGFLVISGDDGLTIPMLSVGADGIISVVANAYPEEFSAMVRLALKGDFIRAREFHFLLIDLINALFADGSPGGIKAVMNKKSLCSDILRLPLVPVKNDTKKLIYKLIDQIEGKK